MLSFRVTEDERDHLRAIADDYGMTVSELMRVAPNGLPRAKKRIVPEANLLLWHELGGVGVNLNQIAYALNTLRNIVRADGPTDPLTAQCLDRADACIGLINELLPVHHALRRELLGEPGE